MIVGTRVAERIDAAGISQAELARRVGVSQPTINNLIRRSKKGSTHLHKVARVLGTTPAYLTGETDDPTAEVPDPPVLTFDQQRLLDCFIALSPVPQQALLTIAITMAGQAA